MVSLSYKVEESEPDFTIEDWQLKNMLEFLIRNHLSDWNIRTQITIKSLENLKEAIDELKEIRSFDETNNELILRGIKIHCATGVRVRTELRTSKPLFVVTIFFYEKDSATGGLVQNQGKKVQHAINIVLGEMEIETDNQKVRAMREKLSSFKDHFVVDTDSILEILKETGYSQNIILVENMNWPIWWFPINQEI